MTNWLVVDSISQVYSHDEQLTVLRFVQVFAATSSSSNYYLQQRSEEAAEILEEKVKFAEEEANLLAKQATEAQQEILRIRQENNKVPASSRLMQLLGCNAM